MTMEREVGGEGAAVIRKAMLEETLLLQGATLQLTAKEIAAPVVLAEQAAACLGAAMFGAAQRFLREHPERATDEMRRLAMLGERVSRALPNDLQLLWTVRYSGGYALDVYAAATGLRAEEVLSDYRRMSRVLVDVTRRVSRTLRVEQSAGDAAKNW